MKKEGVIKIPVPFDNIELVVGKEEVTATFTHKGEFMFSQHFGRLLGVGDLITIKAQGEINIAMEAH